MARATKAARHVKRPIPEPGHQQTSSRIPPQNLDAEMAVIASVCLMPKAIEELGELRAEHFYADRHQMLWQSITALRNQGQPFDAVTLAEELDSRKQLAEIGGVEYLNKVLETVPNAAHAKYYAGIVRDRWLQRSLVYSCTEILEECYSATTGTEELLAAAEKRVLALRDFAGINAKLPSFATMTSAELDAADLRVEYLVESVLVRRQPGVVAAVKKALKTTTAIDLTLSLASGCPFLGKFYVPMAVRVALMSGESGDATIQETARRIARSKPSINLSDYTNAVWSFDLPRLGQPQTKRDLTKFIRDHALDVLIVDPAYLCLDLGDDAGNLFSVGKKLRELTEVGHETGCTVVIVHHNRKATNNDQFAAPELESIAWSGFQEWARQWILLGRREAYDPEQAGSHKLWLSVGGSAGHSGLWALDIEEGCLKDQGGRRWDVSVATASTAIAATIESREEAKVSRADEKAAAQIGRDSVKLLAAYKQHPAGDTAKAIRESLGMSTQRFGPANAKLVADGQVEAIVIVKNKHDYAGFRLKQTTGTDRDSTGIISVSPGRSVEGDSSLFRESPLSPVTDHAQTITATSSESVPVVSGGALNNQFAEAVA